MHISHVMKTRELIFLVIFCQVTFGDSWIAADFSRALARATFETPKWQHRDIQLVVDRTQCPKGLDVDGILADASVVWNTAPGNPIRLVHSIRNLEKMEMAASKSSANEVYSQTTTVACESEFESVTGANPDHVPAAAHALVSGVQILSAQLLLNVSKGRAHISVYEPTTLRVVVAHELGHVLGLQHSREPNSLMYFNATGKRGLKLAQVDVDELKARYPAKLLTSSGELGLQLGFNFATLKSDVQQLFDQFRIRIARNFHHFGVHAD